MTKILVPGRIQPLILSLLMICFLFPSFSHAQQDEEVYSNAYLAEKIYLQLDRKIYTVGETLWFKAIVQNTFQQQPSSISGVLYVELIAEDESTVKKKIIKLDQGIGEGFFIFSKNLSAGHYQIRAYTEWNKNFGTDFVFKEYIQVFAYKDLDKKPIETVLLPDQSGQRQLNILFDPHIIDSLHQQKLKVFIEMDDKRDSLRLKINRDKKYQLDYVLSSKHRFAKIVMQTSNGERFGKTIALDEAYLDLQFFPESGELVHGLPGKVGFKAVGVDGRSRMVKGEIVDEQGVIHTLFTSNTLGMGSFTLYDPDSTKKYFARIVNESETILPPYPLPKVSATGNILSLVKEGEDLRVSAFSNYHENDSIQINISFRGILLYQVKTRFKNYISRLKIANKDLPEGIIAFTLVDDHGQPVAERLYFNEKTDQRTKIEISTDEHTYPKRGLTQLTIETRDSSHQQIPTNLSLLVINKNLLGESQDLRQNILSSFLLSSELKGEIENPGYYFRESVDSESDLDNLMLTQGWRKYHYSKPYKNLPFLAEANLTVSGKLGNVSAKKIRKEVELTMVSFGSKELIYQQVVDSLGRFKFNLDDEYGQDLDLVFESALKNSKNIRAEIILDQSEPPSVDFDQLKSVGKIDQSVEVFARNNAEWKKIDEQFYLDSEDLLLEEFIVSGYRLTPERKKVIEEYGVPDEVITGKEIQEKEHKSSYGIYSVLRTNFGDKVEIVHVRNGILRARVRNPEITLVVVDGIPVQPRDYSLISSIPPSEVRSFEIIEYAKNFGNLFCSLFPVACKQFRPPQGNVIAIYTHANGGIHGAKTPVGIVRKSVPVFSVQKEFYAPKYDGSLLPENNKPDFRTLVYWAPNLNTTDNGKVSVQYYNTDYEGEMMVVVESISEDGNIGYQTHTYTVEGN